MSARTLRLLVLAIAVAVPAAYGLGCFPPIELATDAAADAADARPTESDASPPLDAPIAPSHDAGADALAHVDANVRPPDAITDAAPDSAPRSDAGFPATAVLDSFDRAPSSALGAAWSSYQVGVADAAAVFLPTMGDPNGGVARFDTVFGANQEVHAVLRQIVLGAGGEVGLFVKYAAVSSQPGGRCYSWDYYVYVAVNLQNGGGYVESCRLDGVGEPKLDRQNVVAPWQGGDRLGARVGSNNRVLVFRNGAPIADIDLGTWPHATSGGQIGIGFTRSAGSVVDDFGGGNAPAP